MCSAISFLNRYITHKPSVNQAYIIYNHTLPLSLSKKIKSCILYNKIKYIWKQNMLNHNFIHGFLEENNSKIY